MRPTEFRERYNYRINIDGHATICAVCAHYTPRADKMHGYCELMKCSVGICGHCDLHELRVIMPSSAQIREAV